MKPASLASELAAIAPALIWPAFAIMGAMALGVAIESLWRAWLAANDLIDRD